MVLINNAGSVLGFVALLVAAVAVAYGTLNRTTIATQKDSIEAYEQRLRQLEGQSVRDTAEIKRLATENQVLRGVVSGTEQLVAIRGALIEQHHEQMQTLNAILGKLERSA